MRRAGITDHDQLESRNLRTPRAAAVAGIIFAVLLIGIGISPWVELVFPAWILALSLEVLAVGGRAPADPAAERHP